MRQSNGRRPFVDLFCGIGGASQGAADAGFDVVLAVDDQHESLDVHASNHPNAQHVCLKLPCQHHHLNLPKAEENWHIHGSPPCTLLSSANKTSSAAEKRDSASLVSWYVQFALESTASSWSMEQVPSKEVLLILDEFKRQWPEQVAYTVVDFYFLGVPQNRKRVIAGSLGVVANIAMRGSLRGRVVDFIRDPMGTHVRNDAVARNSARGGAATARIAKDLKRAVGSEWRCKPIKGPAPCVTASNRLNWATPSGNRRLIPLTVKEMGMLQCFPEDYIYDIKNVKRDAYRGIGNALPPIVMKRMLKGKQSTLRII